MGRRGSDAAHLIQRVKALITTISIMKSEYPLKPVWGGLPRGDEHGRIVDEPPVYDEAEQQIPDLLTYPPREMSGFRWREMERPGERVWAAVRERLARSAAAEGR
jgi:hypothetical protein